MPPFPFLFFSVCLLSCLQQFLASGLSPISSPASCLSFVIFSFFFFLARGLSPFSSSTVYLSFVVVCFYLSSFLSTSCSSSDFRYLGL